MSTCRGLFYAKKSRNRVHLYSHFLCCTFWWVFSFSRSNWIIFKHDSLIDDTLTVMSTLDQSRPVRNCNERNYSAHPKTSKREIYHQTQFRVISGHSFFLVLEVFVLDRRYNQCILCLVDKAKIMAWDIQKRFKYICITSMYVQGLHIHVHWFK